MPEGAEVPIDMLPGGDDPLVVSRGEEIPEFMGGKQASKKADGSIYEAELA